MAEDHVRLDDDLHILSTQGFGGRLARITVPTPLITGSETTPELAEVTS